MIVLAVLVGWLMHENWTQRHGCAVRRPLQNRAFVTALVNNATAESFQRRLYGLWESACLHRVPLTVFHDATSSDYCGPFERVSIVRVGVPEVCDVRCERVHRSPRAEDDLRWLVYSDHLRAHRYGFVLFVGADDALFGLDPFELLVHHARLLFTGRDTATIGSRAAIFDACGVPYEHYANATALDVGVLGGPYSAAKWAVDAFAARLEERSPNASCESAVANSVLLDPTSVVPPFVVRHSPHHGSQGNAFVAPIGATTAPWASRVQRY